MSLKPFAVDHIQITFPSHLEEAMISFYGHIMGFEQIDKPEPLKSRGGAWFQVGDLQIHVSREDGDGQAQSKRHICYLVPDLAEACSWFAQNKIEATSEETEPNGLKRFFIRDPAGNRVEIGERP